MPKKTYPMMGWFRFWHMVLIFCAREGEGEFLDSNSFCSNWTNSLVGQAIDPESAQVICPISVAKLESIETQCQFRLKQEEAGGDETHIQ